MKTIRSLLLPIMAVCATFWSIWVTYNPVPVAQSKSSMEQVRQEAERGGYRLIDLKSLREIYRHNRAEILLVDTRQEWEHRAGFIDGSVNFPMEPTRWARWQRRGELKALLGPEKDKSIIFY